MQAVLADKCRFITLTSPPIIHIMRYFNKKSAERDEYPVEGDREWRSLIESLLHK